MPRLALALCAFWFLSLFVFRTVVQLRSTGSTGVKGFHGRIGSLPWIAGASATLGLLSAPVGPLGAVLDWPAGDLLVVNRALHLLGAVCAVLGIAGALSAQLSMGDSWRVGVDEEETTALVTDGLFAWVRNPIFSFIILSLVGLVLLVPNLLTLAAAAFTLLGIELQVRAVEEPYLERTHGDAYREYSSRVGRFLPRTGLRPPTKGASGAGMFLLVAALLTAMASSQPVAAEMMRGQVTESGTRAPLPLVSVATEGNESAAETDEHGQFEVAVDERAVLRFEYPGWKTQTVSVELDVPLAVELEPDDVPMLPNFDNTESIVINASPTEIWNYVTDYEKNWVASNPEHISVRFLADDKTFRNGIRFVLSEHVGNGRADMTGYLTDVVPNETYTWVARAVYTGFGGFSVRVDQTGTFSLEPVDGGVLVSHRIRASFPHSFWGQLARFVAENVGDAAGDASAHTMLELDYFKAQLEAQALARNE